MHVRAQLHFAVSALTILLLTSCGALRACSSKDESAAVGAAQAKVGSATPDASCDRCRARLCSNADGQNGVDLVAGCFKAPDPKLAPGADANFARDCQAVMRCAFAHDCAYDPVLGPVRCYCGSRRVDECLAQGPAPDAPCVEEWKTAARSAKNAEVLERFSLVTYPSGWAFNLLECDRDRCGPKSEAGRCTP